MKPAEFPFNDELLIEEKDRKLAEDLYPHIHNALIHPELVAEFKPIDEAANRAKSGSRRWGFLAVFLVTAALLGTSAAPLYENWKELADWIVAVSAGAGILGAGFGFFGVLFASAKRRWLHNRFLTERLRQFHFQSLIALAPEILQAAESGNWEPFYRKRAAEFARFKRDVIEPVVTIYDTTVTNETEQNHWLFSAHPSLPAMQHSGELLLAYERLRIQRQIRYASHKLRDDGRALSRMPVTQARRLDLGALLCVLVLVLLHVLIIPLIFLHVHTMAFVHVLAIWLAILALALRTIEEGLKPHREIERYRHYRSALENIERKFKGGPASKLTAMTDLERLTFDEMINFLKSNHEARFVM